jgi:hypothetical protein
MVYTRTRNSRYAQYARAAGASAQFTIPSQLQANFGLGDWMKRLRGKAAGQMGKATKYAGANAGDAVDAASEAVENGPNAFQKAGGYMKGKAMGAGQHVMNNKKAYGIGAAGAGALAGGGYAASRYLDDEEA